MAKKKATKKKAVTEPVAEVTEQETAEQEASEASTEPSLEEAVLEAADSAAQVSDEGSADDEFESPLQAPKESVALTPTEVGVMEAEQQAQQALETSGGLVDDAFTWTGNLWHSLTVGMGPDVRVTIGLIGLMLGAVGLYYVLPGLTQIDFGTKTRSLLYPLQKSVVIKGFLLGFWIFLSVRMVTEDTSSS